MAKSKSKVHVQQQEQQQKLQEKLQSQKRLKQQNSGKNSTANALAVGAVAVVLGVIVWLTGGGSGHGSQPQQPAPFVPRPKEVSVEFWNERLETGKPYRHPPDCKDKYPIECPRYGTRGCKESPGWMIVHCPVTCRSCDLVHPSRRCDYDFLNLSKVPAYAPGDMDEVFTRMVSDPALEHFDLQVYSRDPWVVSVDNFLSEAEVASLLAAPGLEFVRSTDTGNFDENTGSFKKLISQHRTSQSAWCMEECMTAQIAKKIAKRISNIVAIPEKNWENFQFLKYTEGQYYKVHHDYTPGESLDGPRVLTVFLYLSEVVEGGATCFPNLPGLNGEKPLCISPKTGRALIWPSVLSNNPSMKDSRTMHEAKEVIRGHKFAANAWVHLHDYKIPNLWGCTGIFNTIDDSDIENLEEL